jgi:hypothetical protein
MAHHRWLYATLLLMVCCCGKNVSTVSLHHSSLKMRYFAEPMLDLC